MKIGLMADIHERLDTVERAIEFFNRQSLEHILYTDDLVSPFVVSKFSKPKAKLYYVWGNNEGDRRRVRERFEDLGVSSLGEVAKLELGGQEDRPSSWYP